MSNKPKLAKTKPDPSTAVSLCYVHRESVEYSWHQSLIQMLSYDAANNTRLARGGFVAMYGGTDGLAHARNTAVRDFLNDNRADWLFWVDTDMGFEPDTVDRLFAQADPVERPIVGALCFAAIHEEPDGFGGYEDIFMPTILDWTHTADSTGFSTRWNYPKDSMTRCSGTGSACILIHKSVFEKIRDANQVPGALPWQGWYSRVINPKTGALVGEDLSFCLRALQMDIPVWIDTSVKTTHKKPMWLSEKHYWQQRAFAAPLHPHPYVPSDQPEVDPELVSVLIPFRAEPDSHRAKLLQYCLSLWTDMPQVEVIVSDDGQDGPFNVSKAVNRAREQANGKMLLVIGSDHIPPDADRMRWIRELLQMMPWAGVYERTLEFTEDATMALLAGANPMDHLKDVTEIPACMGIFAVRADVWDDLGGMDERFAGWGYEDTAFRTALGALYPDGNPQGSGQVYTLWHPSALRGEIPAGEGNQALFAEYVEAFQSQTMRQYLESVKG